MKHLGSALALCALASAGLLALGCSSSSNSNSSTTISHVLLLSVDGMHPSDLSNWVAQNPTSTLASLASTGVTYTSAQTQLPSDSFPGLLSLVTGGTPNSTGVFYDASFNRTLLPPTGASNYGINGAGNAGTLVFYDESIDKGFNGGAFGNGATPLLNTGASSIDSTMLPLDPTTKAPIYPHSYNKVNTIFELIHTAGHRTAWCDKHAAYDLVTGPSGAGVDDIFTPEINSPVINGDGDYTKATPDAVFNDNLKVQAVLNEIAGFDHTGTTLKGVPTLFGMNFQALSVSQKLKGGGYEDAAGAVFSPMVQTGLASVDDALGRMVSGLKTAGIYNQTLIILTAKHGQSPIDPTKLVHFNDSATTTLDATNPNPTSVTEYLFSRGIQAYTNANDTCYFLWLKDQTKTAAAVTALQAGAATAVGPISSILSGTTLKAYFNDPLLDTRVPDIIILPPPGTVYTGGSKIAEHGGFNPDDRSVALLLSNPSFKAATVSTAVTTPQVAPSILKALSMDPTQLQAVQKEGTAVLPGLPF